MNTNQTLGALALATMLFAGEALAQNQGVDKVLKPLPASAPGEWWRSSWQAGNQYFHDAQFELVCVTKLIPGQTPRWMDNVATKNLAAGASMRVGGIAHASSFVLEGSPNPLFFRYYESIHMDRALSGKFEVLGNTQGMHQWLFKDGIQTIVKDAVNWLGSAVVSFLSSSPIPPALLGMSGVGESLGKKAQEGTEKYLNGKGVVIVENGFEINKKSEAFSKLPFASELAGLDNLAVQMTEDFRNRMFLFDSKEGKLELRDGTESADKLFAVMDKPAEAKALIAALPAPSSDRVKAVLQRETIAMNSDIFDGKTRKIGDIWTIDGGVLSGFLHPDLKGNFQGRVVLKYEKDASRKSSHSKDKGVVYTAQVLRILGKAEVAGQTVFSNLEYVESKFRAKINDETEATIYVDAKLTMVREALLIFQTDASREVLPDMVITSGLQAAGKARFKVSYYATREEISKTHP